MDSSDPAAPKIIHAFMPRDTKGYSIKETWDVLGMRATRSDDTVLEGAFVPDKYIGRVVSAGAAGIDHFVLGIFRLGASWPSATSTMAWRNVLLDWTIDNIKSKTSIGTVAFHGVSRRGAACGRRDGHRNRVDRPTPRQGRRRLVAWGRLRPRLGLQDRCGQVSSSRRSLASRRPPPWSWQVASGFSR